MMVFFATESIAQNRDSTAVDSSRIQLQGDSLNTTMRDTLSRASEEEPESGHVAPWREAINPNANIITNDSLLRWQIWPNWGDHQAYRREVISFRQGTIGRVDAFHINGYQPPEQELEMEGISLNDAITGLPNYNLVPHRKIGLVTEGFSGNYQSDIRLKDYYIVKPISYLNYDEADGNYRNLEFMVTQNFTEGTNAEISYWDRRGGGYYPNSQVEGSQVMARVYHHLNDRYLLRAMYLRNQLSNEEPFGYNLGDPATYAFDEFSSLPLNTNASSEFNRWDLTAGIYQREDTTSAEAGGFELGITNNDRELFYSGDTLSSGYRNLSSSLFKELQWNRLTARGEVNLDQYSTKISSPISIEEWTVFSAKGILDFNIKDESWLYVSGESGNRNDGDSDYDATAGLNVRLFNLLKLHANISTYSRMPTIQSKYWSQGNYTGTSALENETGISTSAKIDFNLTHSISFGASGRIKSARGAIFLTPDSSFTNSGNFDQITGMLYGRFENELFEFESSGVVQQFSYEEQNPGIAALNQQDPIFWLRNSAFIKGYVFDRAAYLKIGVKTLLSPFNYSARTFNPELGFWQGGSTYQDLPPFFRLDGELSARVRRIMVVIRWENALEGFGQAGYFEAAGYPMPPRRLLVGIRAQFRN
jgi:hypothetical protein